MGESEASRAAGTAGPAPGFIDETEAAKLGKHTQLVAEAGLKYFTASTLSPTAFTETPCPLRSLLC